MPIEFSLTVPTLVTADIEATKRFYVDKLGFEVNYEETTGLFFSVRRGEAFVHFAKSDLPARSNRDGWQERVKPADVSFFIQGIDELFEEYKAKGVEITSPPKKQSYGITDMDVVDCNGYVLRYNQPH